MKIFNRAILTLLTLSSLEMLSLQGALSPSTKDLQLIEDEINEYCEEQNSKRQAMEREFISLCIKNSYNSRIQDLADLLSRMYGFHCPQEQWDDENRRSLVDSLVTLINHLITQTEVTSEAIDLESTMVKLLPTMIGSINIEKASLAKEMPTQEQKNAYLQEILRKAIDKHLQDSPERIAFEAALDAM